MTLDEAIIYAKEMSENQYICEECQKEHGQLADWLEELKSLREKSNWIPCSKRLPEDGQTVLAYIGGRHNSCNYLCACHTVEEYTDRWRNVRTGFAILCEVIAWMPLPKPYREG